MNFMSMAALRATLDPVSPLSGPCVIVEGTGTGPVVRIPWGSGTKCGLSGFVLTKGIGRSAAAVYCAGASPTLSNCLIVGNRCNEVGGAVLYFYDSRAVLTNCTIADNHAGQDGAGLVLEDSDIMVLNSILWDNSPSEISCRGESEPDIRHRCS